MGVASDAVVLKTTWSSRFGVIEFATMISKVDFWMKVRYELNDDEDSFGDIFFRNNYCQTKEEREREKRRGYTKYPLSQHPNHKATDIKII